MSILVPSSTSPSTPASSACSPLKSAKHKVANGNRIPTGISATGPAPLSSRAASVTCVRKLVILKFTFFSLVLIGSPFLPLCLYGQSLLAHVPVTASWMQSPLAMHFWIMSLGACSLSTLVLPAAPACCCCGCCCALCALPSLRVGPLLCGFCAPLVRLAIISPHSLYFSSLSFDSRIRCTKGPEVSYLIRWLSFLAHPASTACSNPHLVHGLLPFFWANPTVALESSTTWLTKACGARSTRELPRPRPNIDGTAYSLVSCILRPSIAPPAPRPAAFFSFGASFDWPFLWPPFSSSKASISFVSSGNAFFIAWKS